MVKKLFVSLVMLSSVNVLCAQPEQNATSKIAQVKAKKDNKQQQIDIDTIVTVGLVCIVIAAIVYFNKSASPVTKDSLDVLLEEAEQRDAVLQMYGYTKDRFVKEALEKGTQTLREQILYPQ